MRRTSTRPVEAADPKAAVVALILAQSTRVAAHAWLREELMAMKQRAVFKRGAAGVGRVGARRGWDCGACAGESTS